VYWKSGRYAEQLGRECSLCQDGNLVLRRMLHRDQTIIIIGCSNYPNCKFSTSIAKLPGFCKDCGKNLTIRVGKAIILSCDLCKYKHKVALSPYAKPYLVEGLKVCAHQLSIEACKSCSESIVSKKSLVELELPDIARKWRYIRNETDLAYDWRKEKLMIGDESRLLESYEVDVEGEVEWKSRYNRPVEIQGVLGMLYRVHVFLEDDDIEDDPDIERIQYVGLRAREAESLAADYEYSEQDIKAALFAQKVDRQSESADISPGHCIEELSLNHQNRFRVKEVNSVQIYATGKSILKYFELVFSSIIRQDTRDSDGSEEYSKEDFDREVYEGYVRESEEMRDLEDFAD